MKIELWWSDKISRSPARFKEFTQKMVNRLLVGALRYGPPNASQNYMTRMIMEMKAYKRSGNAEQLYNIANYAFLESECPENKRFHFDATADSVTRGKLGGSLKPPTREV